MENNKKFKFPQITLALLLIIIAIISVIGGCCTNIIFQNQYKVIVTDKDIKHYKNGDDYEDKYMIYTEDIETGEVRVFEDTDSLILLKFNSSDIYAQIKVGKSYNMDVRGLRIRILSSYQNIYKAEEIK